MAVRTKPDESLEDHVVGCLEPAGELLRREDSTWSTGTGVQQADDVGVELDRLIARGAGGSGADDGHCVVNMPSW